MHLRSKVSSDGRIVVPRTVGKRLKSRARRLRALHCRSKERSFFVETPQDANDPFATFSEWVSKADEEAYADL